MVMGASRRLFLFSSIIIQLVALTIAQSFFIDHYCSNMGGNYTNSSTYQTDLNSLLSLLSSNNEINYGFYNFSVGQVNAIALCRGDVALDKCRSCVNYSTQNITQVCPNQKEAIGWNDECMLRYSNRSIFGVVENEPNFEMPNSETAPDVNQLNQALQPLLIDLQSRAASGDSLRKFATGTAVANFQTIYALVQCTPDLSKQQCTDCLASAIGKIPDFFPGKEGGRVVRPSCNFRFEIYPFFQETTDTTSPPPSPLEPPVSSTPTRGRENGTSRTVIVVVVLIVGVVILIICIYMFLRTRRTKTREKVENVDDISSVESLQFDFGTIRAATDNFSDANKLGQGGFGAVYKGMLTNGQDIAVKRLSMDSGQGDLEFKNEVLLVAKLQHRNLVRLLGFCLERSERLLIYEFVPNTSLDHFIFDRVKRLELDWQSRYKIIGGIARGLLYLHEDSRLRIIHRDLKVSNILLDGEMNAKISDFGMARLFVQDETQGNTSRIVGTYGYMAPEYALHGQFSVKSDVFSFGVLILEILSGQKNRCFRNGENVEDLLSCAWKFWREGTSIDLIDPILRASLRIEMMRCIHIGLLCVQENAADRPNMASVVLMLNSYSFTLPVPSQPAFFTHSTIESDMSSSLGYNLRGTESNQSKYETLPLAANEASITEVYPR